MSASDYCARFATTCPELVQLHIANERIAELEEKIKYYEARLREMNPYIEICAVCGKVVAKTSLVDWVCPECNEITR